MKKSKFLSPLLSASALAIGITPVVCLTSCNNNKFAKMEIPVSITLDGGTGLELIGASDWKIKGTEDLVLKFKEKGDGASCQFCTNLSTSAMKVSNNPLPLDAADFKKSHKVLTPAFAGAVKGDGVEEITWTFSASLLQKLYKDSDNKIEINLKSKVSEVKTFSITAESSLEKWIIETTKTQKFSVLEGYSFPTNTLNEFHFGLTEAGKEEVKKSSDTRFIVKFNAKTISVTKSIGSTPDLVLDLHWTGDQTQLCTSSGEKTMNVTIYKPPF